MGWGREGWVVGGGGGRRTRPVVIAVAASVVGVVGVADVVELPLFLFALVIFFIFWQGRGEGRGYRKGGTRVDRDTGEGGWRWEGAPANSTSVAAKMTSVSAARGTLVYGAAVAATLLAAVIIHVASAFCFFVARFLARADSRPVRTREGAGGA